MMADDGESMATNDGVSMAIGDDESIATDERADKPVDVDPIVPTVGTN
jgi:hypothetical protein